MTSRPHTGFRNTSLAVLAAAALAILILAMLSLGTARADEEQTTQGEAGSGTGGTATIDNIADLTYHGDCVAPDSTDYDDDPVMDPNDPRYWVTPTLGDEPLKEACKYIFVRNPNDVNELQLTIRHGAEDGPIVFSQLIPGSASVPTEGKCDSYLGSAGTSGTVAHGLVETDQKTAEYITDFKNYCIQDTGAVYVVVFPVRPAARGLLAMRRHLPHWRLLQPALLRAADRHQPDHRLRERHQRCCRIRLADPERQVHRRRRFLHGRHQPRWRRHRHGSRQYVPAPRREVQLDAEHDLRHGRGQVHPVVVRCPAQPPR
ncbi:MAG: hypothetical protein U5Q44_02925 [Dehalococcoidia bacterium]|nr:hypothetical protein [Dehalococcoidia bacterium]